MTIKDAMKKFVVGTGGTTSLKSTTDLHDEINTEFGTQINPLIGLVVDTDIDADTDLLGKVIGDIQTGVHIYKNSIEGTSYYVDEYTGFSGDTTQQQGHYIVLHAYVPGSNYEYADGVRITVTGGTSGPVTLDSDGILVFHFKNDNKNQVITFTASKEGSESYSRSFDLSRIFLSKDKAPD